jgi:hypothetical protein
MVAAHTLQVYALDNSNFVETYHNLLESHAQMTMHQTHVLTPQSDQEHILLVLFN